MPVKVRPNGNYKCRMAASGWHPAHFTQKTCSFQVKTGLLHPLILKQMRQPLFSNLTNVYRAKLKMNNSAPYSRKYFRMNSTASTYIRGDIPLVLPAPM